MRITRSAELQKRLAEQFKSEHGALLGASGVSAEDSDLTEDEAELLDMLGYARVDYSTSI